MLASKRRPLRRLPSATPAMHSFPAPALRSPAFSASTDASAADLMQPSAYGNDDEKYRYGGETRAGDWPWRAVNI